MNYFQKHWYGQLSLKKSFWINTILLNFVIAIPVSLIIGYLLILQKYVLFSQFLMNYFLFRIFLNTWEAVGVYRSGRKETTKRFWSFLSQIFVILILANAILSFILLIVNPQQVLEFWIKNIQPY